MTRPVLAALAAAAAILAAAAGEASSPAPYRSGAPPAHTGGFGEPLCSACHAGDEAPAAGALEIRIPSSYRPGKAYEIAVVLADPAMAAAGFQLAVRQAEGPDAGAQAGGLVAVDSGVAVVTVGGVQYAGHVEGGTDVTDGRREWRLIWRAPAGGGAVVFHAAANAANDDDSELGDRIHHARRTIGPARGTGRASPGGGYGVR